MSSITSKQSRLKIRLTESQFKRLLTIFFACFLTMKNFALEKSGLFFFFKSDLGWRQPRVLHSTTYWFFYCLQIQKKSSVNIKRV